MRRCDRERISPPWPREKPLCAYDPIAHRMHFVAGVRGDGPPASGPFVSRRLTEHLREWVPLP